MIRVRSVGLVGIDGLPVDVEVGHADGLPGLDITGLPAASLREARHRVRSSLRASGYPWPRRRVVANFAPAHVPKRGTGFDLPLAVAILALEGVLRPADVKGGWFFGELGLDGQVRSVPGAVNVACAVRREGSGHSALYIGEGNGREASAVPDVDVRAVPGLVGLVEWLREGAPLPEVVAAAPRPSPRATVELSDVRGQLAARRALEVASAGGHSLMLVGPPGCGKTMLARAMPGLLPPMEVDEALEVTRVHSASGLRPVDAGLVSERPFRAPHATASYAALVGGGSPPSPGEVSLAHRGVLFLDELPEFRRESLEALRAPLEDGEVWVARSRHRVVYPSRFALVCAMNPCPCGHLFDDRRRCRCSARAVSSYHQRVSGPLLDRIDISVSMRAVAPDDLGGSGHPEGSAVVAARVREAWCRQRARAGGKGAVSMNAELSGARLDEAVGRSEALPRVLALASRELGVSARGWARTLRVARTVADLEGSCEVREEHLMEALSFRRRVLH